MDSHRPQQYHLKLPPHGRPNNRPSIQSANLQSFSLELERAKSHQHQLPTLSVSKRTLVRQIQDDIRIIREKLLRQEKMRQILNQNRNNYMPQQIPIPFPMQMPYQPQPPPMPFPFQYPFGGCPCQHNCQPKKKRKNKKAKKQKKEEPVVIHKKKKMFRVYAYAVYFSIFIRHYSRKFTNHRRRWFNDRYSKPTSKSIIFIGSEKILEELYRLDLYTMIRDAERKRVPGHVAPATINWQEETNTALVLAQSTSNKGEIVSKSEQLINLVEILFEKLENILSNKQLMAEYHEVFSVGSLYQSFMISNLYLPQQTPFLFIHPTKGYLKIGYQEEIQLLAIKLIIKIVIFNYLLGIRNSRIWSTRMEKAHKLDNTQIEQLWDTARSLALYLYIVSKEFYILGLRNTDHTSNFGEIAKRFGVRAAKSLEDPLEDDRSSKSKSSSKRKDSYELIHNLKGLQEMQQMVQKNSKLNKFKETVKQRMVELLANLYEKLKEEERQVYRYTKKMTLETPYIILSSDTSKEDEKKAKMKELLNPNRSKNILLRPKNNYKNGLEESNNTNSELSLSSNKKKNNVSVRFNQSSQLRQPSQHLKNSYNESGQFEQLKSSMRKDSIFPSAHSNESEQRQPARNENSQTSRRQKVKNKYGRYEPPSSLGGRMDTLSRPFNMDIVNEKSVDQRQDRLRQKFRNILNYERPPAPAA